MKVLNDLLWDGELKIFQEEDGFKFSLDSILLANFVTINKRCKNILDIGTGNAPIPLMLSKRCKCRILGVEIQKESYDLALESIHYNNLENQIDIVNGNINEVYKNFENNYFDVIVSNPPYYKFDMKLSLNSKKLIARSENNFSILDLFLISKKLLKNGGNIALVINTKRLSEVIINMKKNNIEPKKIQFVYPKINRESNIVLIEGTKNGKEGLKVLEPIIIQDLENNYTNYIKNILENFGKY